MSRLSPCLECVDPFWERNVCRRCLQRLCEQRQPVSGMGRSVMRTQCVSTMLAAFVSTRVLDVLTRSGNTMCLVDVCSVCINSVSPCLDWVDPLILRTQCVSSMFAASVSTASGRVLNGSTRSGNSSRSTKSIEKRHETISSVSSISWIPTVG